VTKLLALFGLVIFGFILTANAETWHHNRETGFSIQQLTSSGFLPYTGWAAFGAIAASMVGSLFSSDSWNNVTFIAGEIQNPQRNIGLSLFLGTLIVTSIYLLANIMYVSVLDLPSIAFAENDRVGVVASQHIFGEEGTMIVAIFLMISTFGCDNGLILAGARVYYTMANDGLFFKKVGELNKNGVPEKALWIQCAWASVLCLSGKYGELLDYVIFAVLIFYALTILGIIRLRIKKPELERPYKAFGYPFVPLLYIFTATCICILLLIYKPNYTWPGLGLVLLGIPVFYILKKNNSEL
jgi:APA family basic amino acid/polyamine antiporter